MKLAGYATAMLEAWRLVNDLYIKYIEWHERGLYTIEVEDGDLYRVVTEWLSDTYDLDNIHRLRVSTNGGSSDKRLLYSLAEHPGDIVVDGHRVRVSLGDRKSVGELETVLTNLANAKKNIVFSTRTRAGRDALLVKLQELLAHSAANKAGLYVPSRWGDWNRHRELPHRTIDSIVYPDGQGQRLLADLKQFLNAEKRYDEYGVPWHRGYLLHGDPGTGKTSTSLALAYETGRDVYYLPLGDLESDISLFGLVSSVPSKSILLIEDVDIFNAVVQRSQEDKEVSMAAILNVLDGALTPHGLVVIMTTNHYEKLDPAIIRSGRIDMSEAFYSKPELQIRELYERFYGKQMPDIELDASPADAVTTFISTDSTDALAQLQRKINASI